MRVPKKKAILAWHFVYTRDGVPSLSRTLNLVPVLPGNVYSVRGPIRFCENGLHASEQIINAYSYCRGRYLCRVKLWGEVFDSRDSVKPMGHNQKFVASHRQVLWMTGVTLKMRSAMDYYNEPRILKIVSQRRKRGLLVKRNTIAHKARKQGAIIREIA